MSQTGTIRAIIAEQRAREAGAAFLANAVRARMGDGASAAEVESAVAFCREILDAVPLLIDRLREAAEQNGIGALVEPMLGHAEAYFVNPLDALSEALVGELGLLDDAYLALSTIRLVQAEPNPLIRVDLDPPIAFLEQLLGASILAQLQAEKAKAVRALMDGLERLAAAAEQRRRQAAEARAREAERQRPQAPRPSASSVTMRGRQCPACSGLGSTTCGACGGYGYHTSSHSRVDWQGNTEHVTERTPCGCSGGRVTCRRCGGSGLL